MLADNPTRGLPCIFHSFRTQVHLKPEAASVLGDVGGEPQFKRAASVGWLDKWNQLDVKPSYECRSISRIFAFLKFTLIATPQVNDQRAPTFPWKSQKQRSSTRYRRLQQRQRRAYSSLPCHQPCHIKDTTDGDPKLSLTTERAASPALGVWPTVRMKGVLVPVGLSPAGTCNKLPFCSGLSGIQEVL